MRISTNQFYQVNGEKMSAAQSKVAELQAKLGSGKQLVKPSEDPGKSNLISGLEGAKKRQEVYTKNVDAAETRLTAESAVLESMTNIMQRITQLTVQSANDTLGVSDRDVIATEIQALRDELFNLGNTRDLTGAYIFSGNKTSSPAFSEDPTGVVSYNGDYGRLEINVSDVRSIAINTLGPDLFSPADFAALSDLVTDLRANDGAGIKARVADVNDINDRLINSYGAMAGRLAAIESQRTVIDETTLRIDELLIREDDLDYAEAVTELSKESVALQALQASFVKVAELSLFNFLR
ncbi:flagellar hook-associated protein FlgL [Luminiphilus sp.]|jgi:flagellar hook-associated protein 3 FlgL|nr:flagellar hook-associated protein FlgL [Luminiphilus sp.]MDA8619995.1 flagellar hook-associated protein FlgL [Luminiphilus sp.]